MVGWCHQIKAHELEHTLEMVKNKKTCMLQPGRLQRVGHDLATGQQEQQL